MNEIPENQESILVLEDGEIINSNSPLAQADPKALDELFSRIDSSLKLSQIPARSDIEKTVFVLRQKRQQFLNEEAKKPIRSAAEKKEIKLKSAKKVTSVKQALELSDLL